ncbi:MAG TPA: putative peptidoglycan glycosyltransferase FtsW [Candidatus Paceibacterota bacterium]
MRRLSLIFSGDRLLLGIVSVLTLGGIAIFSSATLGLLARADASVARAAMTQIIFGLGGGLVAFSFFRLVPIAWLRRNAPWLFAATLALTLAVFIPGFGSHAYGATRWLDLRIITLQPAEFLKVGVVFLVAKLLADRHKQLADYRRGLLPFLATIGVPAVILLLQPNTSAVLLIGATATAMFIAAGAPWRHFFTIVLVGFLALSMVLVVRPYARQRVLTFLDPAADPTGSGYQIQQSLIAIGTGGFVGRGFGESVQKFNYLPEPDGDSVFAVYAEECGFLGALLLIALFFALAARGIVIAGDAHDMFSGLIAFGFSWLLAFQAFVNMAAMLGLMPLTGLPLPFVSHGGTALLVALAEAGVIFNVAAHRRHTGAAPPRAGAAVPR